jgi:hypothetical protein
VSGAFFERAVLKSILGWKEEEEYEALRVASSMFLSQWRELEWYPVSNLVSWLFHP